MRIYKRIIAGSVLCLTSVICLGQTGIISTNRTAPIGIVSFPQSVNTVTASNTKFIDGYVKKSGTSRFIFPVGDNGSFRPFAASADGVTGAYFMENPNSATLPAGAPFALQNKENTITSVSTLEFWDIDGSNTSQITLSWNQASNISALTGNQLSHLTIVGWNSSSSRWEKIMSTVDGTSILGSASTFTSGSITTNLNITPDTYNVYTLASTPSGPLPVTLLSFNAAVDKEKSVLLTWATTQESNSDHFDIEYSLDAKTWQTKGNVVAQGESVKLTNYEFIDNQTVNGENFYRLKMIDKDGTYAYSRIQSIVMEGQLETTFFPNPVSDKLFVRVDNPGIIQKVRLHTISGKEVYTAVSIPNSGIDVQGLAPGVYLVSIVLANGTSYTKKIFVTR